MTQQNQPFQGFAPQQQFVQPTLQPFPQQAMPMMPLGAAPGQHIATQFEFGANMNTLPMGASHPPEIPLGAHILEVQTLACVNGYKGPKANVSFKVLQSNVEGEVGQTREWFRKLSGAHPQMAEIAHREFKALFVALLGFDAESPQLKAFEAAGQLHLLMNQAVKEGQFGSSIGMPNRPVPGLIVRCDATPGKTNPKGGFYLVRRFSPVKTG